MGSQNCNRRQSFDDLPQDKVTSEAISCSTSNEDVLDMDVIIRRFLEYGSTFFAVFAATNFSPFKKLDNLRLGAGINNPIGSNISVTQRYPIQKLPYYADDSEKNRQVSLW